MNDSFQSNSSTFPNQIHEHQLNLTGLPDGRQSLLQTLREFQGQQFSSILSNTIFIAPFINHQDNLNQMIIAGRSQETVIRQLCGELYYARIAAIMVSQRTTQKQPNDHQNSAREECPDQQIQSKEETQSQDGLDQKQGHGKRSTNVQQTKACEINIFHPSPEQIEEFQEISFLDQIYEDPDKNPNFS